MAIDVTKREREGVAADLSEAPDQLVALAEEANRVMSVQDTADLDIEWVLLLDGSYSMRKRYATGEVQDLTDLVTALACATDANGEVELIVFDDQVRDTITLTPKNATGIIQSQVYGSDGTFFPTDDAMGSTDLTGALARAREIIQRTGRFTIVAVIGDGDPNDKNSATAETIAIGKLGGFVKFFALNMVDWLTEVDELEKTRPGAREYDNVHAVEVPKPKSMQPQEFFKLAIKGLPEHIKGASDAGYLNR